MKIKTIFAISLIFCTNFLIFAKPQEKKSNEIIFKYPYEYRVIASKIKNVASPYQDGDYVVFTQKSGPRHIGIIFDFEDYKEIHSFMKKSTTDIDGNEKDSLYFYIVHLPENTEEINYKLIVDGIWTCDKLNLDTNYNPYNGSEVSYLRVTNNPSEQTKFTDNGIRFIYKGIPGKKIRLAGTFTNWDSSIYTLNETRPGFYEICLPLPKGTYYYAYYNGTDSFVDKTNPDRAWSTDGRETSKIIVN